MQLCTLVHEGKKSHFSKLNPFNKYKKISWFHFGMIFNHIFISLILCTFVQFNFFTGWFLELFYLTRFDPVDFQKQKVNWSTLH